MKNKKGSIGAVIGIIILIAVIVLIIIVLIIITGKSNGNTPTLKANYSMKVYIKAINIENEEQVKSNYRLEYNNTIISRGILDEDALTEIIVPKEAINLICWSDKYYLGITHKIFTSEELSSNISKIECKMYEVGGITIKHQGKIIDGESIIKLNISTNKNLQNIKICNSWTAGIISALPRERNIICNSGIWLNWSIDNPVKINLPNMFYRCGNCIGTYCDWIEKCESVSGSICISDINNIPRRYERKVDDCYNTGKTLREESIVIEYIVKANQPTPLDEIVFYIMDSDIRLDVTNRIQRHLTEVGEIQIGADDLNYTIKYEI